MVGVSAYADRKGLNLSNLGLVRIKDYKAAFEIPIYEKIDGQIAKLITVAKFVPPTVIPPPPPPPPVGTILYDSNVHGKWGNGIARTVEECEGDIGPNGLGFYTAASGSPVFSIDGKGVGKLTTQKDDEGDGETHGRIYIACCNYNGILQHDFRVLDDTITSHTTKVRCQHQADNWIAGKAKPEQRFGGIGNGYDRKKVEAKTERYHNIHDNDQKISADLPKDIELNAWVRSRFTYKDEKRLDGNIWIYQKAELDYLDGQGFRKLFEGYHKKPLWYYLDKDSFMARSELWFRNNGWGSVELRNVVLAAA